MQFVQKFKSRDENGALTEQEIALEFREIDRCRRTDLPLFYAAMRIMAKTGEDDFTPSPVEGMGTKFVDGLIVKGADFDETAFTLMKNDMVAMWEVNTKIFVDIVAPFITENLQG